MKCILFLAVAASAFNFGAKKAPVQAAKKAAAFSFGATKKAATAVAKKAAPKAFKAPTRDSLVETPARWGTAFGNFDALQERQATRALKIESEKDDLIPTPAKFLFCFGNPDALRERREARLAKWEWSDSFLARARPDQNNYGVGQEFFDDGLTKLEREQIASGKEAYLTGGAKIRLKFLRGDSY